MLTYESVRSRCHDYYVNNAFIYWAFVFYTVNGCGIFV